MKRIKVLLFSSTAALGGFEKIVYYLAKHIDASRFEVSICVFYGEGIIGQRLLEEGKKVIFLEHGNKGILKKIIKVFNLIRKERYDILYLAGYKVNIIGRIIGKIFSCRIITAQRSTDEHRSKIQNMIDNITTGLSDLYISNTVAARNMLITKKHINPEKITVIYNGIDLNAYSDISADRIKIGALNTNNMVIGVIANLIPYKGHEYFFRSVVEINKEVDNVSILLVGDGVHRNYLENLADSLGIRSQVKFLGIRKDIPELLSCMDIVVLPSLFEGMPNAIMEAMACKKPVVTTNVGGVPELAVDGETAYLVPPREPKLMAEKVIELLKDENKRISFGQKGYERVKTIFSLENMVTSTEAAFERILMDRKRLING